MIHSPSDGLFGFIGVELHIKPFDLIQKAICSISLAYHDTTQQIKADEEIEHLKEQLAALKS